MNKTTLYIIGGVALLLLLTGGGYAGYRYMKQRGIRNNNPGNIRLLNPPAGWQGAVSRAQNTDGTFEQFTSPVYGLRAIFKTLTTYQNKYGLTTIRGIISRWAPASENDTAAYVAAVAAAVGVSPDLPLSYAQRAELVKAIVMHENGVQPYPDTLVNQAQGMA
jgi:hypothetical protein